MQPLDRGLQRRVWQRVYGGFDGALTKGERQLLLRCLARSRENLAVYESVSGHKIYGEAFARLAGETREQIKMLRQMLRT